MKHFRNELRKIRDKVNSLLDEFEPPSTDKESSPGVKEEIPTTTNSEQPKATIPPTSEMKNQGQYALNNAASTEFDPLNKTEEQKQKEKLSASFGHDSIGQAQGQGKKIQTIG